MINKIAEKNKISGISYAYTANGIELPVLDITHPLFESSIDEQKLSNLRKESQHIAKYLRSIPGSFKRFLGKKSYILSGFFSKDSDDNYLNGISTLMAKLGPNLIGSGIKRFLDRKVSKSLFSVAIRMRIRDICKLQARTLVSQLKKSVQTKLCFINIAGGTGSDSINTLLLITEKDRDLLKNREIEINIFDIDTFGPNYAERCINSLSKPGSALNGLDIKLNHIVYDWSNTQQLKDFLQSENGCIMIGSSEGGLFEYGSDKDIINNLQLLYKETPDNFQLVGDTILDIKTVDPSVPAMMKAAEMSFKFLGIEGLKKILKRTNWKTDIILENNPFYALFSLKKR